MSAREGVVKPSYPSRRADLDNSDVFEAVTVRAIHPDAELASDGNPNTLYLFKDAERVQEKGASREVSLRVSDRGGGSWPSEVPEVAAGGTAGSRPCLGLQSNQSNHHMQQEFVKFIQNKYSIYIV